MREIEVLKEGTRVAELRLREVQLQTREIEINQNIHR